MSGACVTAASVGSKERCMSTYTFPHKEALKSAVDGCTSTDPSTAAAARLQCGLIGMRCTGLVTDMNSLFVNKHTFNEDINNWDVNSVTGMNSKKGPKGLTKLLVRE